MLVQDILTQCRYTLSDEDKDRWTDARLISLLNNCITELAKTTTVFVETLIWEVRNKLVDIDLTEYSTKILRAEYLDEPLPFKTFQEMDEDNPEWQLEEGEEVKALVFNRQRNGLIKQYPIVTNAKNDHIEYNQLFGVTTHISYSDIIPTVIVDNNPDEVYDQTQYNEGYAIGDISGIGDAGLIKFYYVRKHEKVTSLTDELIIDDLIEQPLIHYVTGMALRDNQDTQNRQMASEELSYYTMFKEEYRLEKSKLFARVRHTTRYRPND